jgi:hypothetical protein
MQKMLYNNSVWLQNVMIEKLKQPIPLTIFQRINIFVDRVSLKICSNAIVVVVTA